MTEKPEKINLSSINSRKINMDVLQEIHKLFDNLDNMSERYNFTWNGKAKAYFESAIPSTKTLKPQIEESVNFDVSEKFIYYWR